MPVTILLNMVLQALGYLRLVDILEESFLRAMDNLYDLLVIIKYQGGNQQGYSQGGPK